MFGITAAALILAVIGFAGTSINFLAGQLGKFLDQELVVVPPVVKFNVQGLEKLGIIPPGSTAE